MFRVRSAHTDNFELISNKCLNSGWNFGDY